MFTDTVVAINVASSLGLILLVLLHSGKGGGLSDMFGGIGSAAMGSSVMEKNLDRITWACLAIFAFSTLIVGLRWA